MAWLSKPFGSASEAREPETSFPISKPVRSDLTVQIFSHELEIPDAHILVWTYVTQGLAAYGQPEVVFTLRRGAAEREAAYPLEPLRFFAGVCEQARAGHRCEAGNVTQFAGDSPFGRHFAYVPSQPLVGVTIPHGAIAALLVTEDEVIGVHEFGIARFMARLAAASNYFPCPAWSDRERAELPFATTRTASLLSKTPRFHARGVSVLRRGDRLSIHVLASVRATLRRALDQLGNVRPFALLTHIDPVADGCLVWSVGQASATAVTPPGSDGERLSGCFVALVPGQAANEVHVREDGFVLLVSDTSWRELCHAMTEGHNLRLAATGAVATIEVESIGVSPSGMFERTFTPANDTLPMNTGVQLELLRLLSTESEISARTTTAALAAFTREIEQLAQRLLQPTDGEFRVRIEFACTSSGHRVEFASQGVVEHEVLSAFSAAIASQTPLPISEGEIQFQMELVVRPNAVLPERS